MSRPLSKDTQLCISLAARPTNIGTRFHNFLYEELDLDFVYKACTTTDIGAAVAGVRALGIRGCGVSMPFKETCIAYVDALDPSAEAIASVNTIVNTDGRLVAYNTDYLAIAKLLASRQVAIGSTFVLLGSGGMAKAAAAAMRDAGFRSGSIVARNTDTGPALAERYGYAWQPDMGDLRPQLIVNATPIGMAGGPAADDLPATSEAIASAHTIFDVVAFPAETPLVRGARSAGKTVITGADVIALQAVEQFALYTGVRPTNDQVRRASEYSRAQPGTVVP